MPSPKALWPCRNGRAIVIITLWLATFLLYAVTTARDVLPADSGEFQLIAAGWGIAHPPGYPLYTVVGALWTHLLPLGNVAFRLNLLSAALAATTLTLLYEATRVWALVLGQTERAARAGGLIAALLLGSAATFWAQATIANIRMPTLLFTAWGFLALGHYAAHPGERAPKERALLELALVLGLGVGHHPSLAFVALSWAAYLLLTDARLFIEPRRWYRAALVGAAAWLLPQLYLPLRDAMPGAPLAPGNLATWSGFWGHVLAQGFGGDMFAFATLTDLQMRLPLLPTLFRQQFAPPLLAAIAASWMWLLLGKWQMANGKMKNLASLRLCAFALNLRPSSKLALALFVGWAAHTFVAITYRAPQTIEYLAPAYIPMALTLGLSSAALIQATRPTPSTKDYPTNRRLRALLLLATLPLFTRFATRLPDFAVLAADTSIRERVAPLLHAAPEGALILADWHWATPLWVLQAEEGLAPGIEVAYVYPIAGQEYDAVWRMRAETAGERPLFSTHFYDWPGWTFAPVGGGYRLFPRPLTALPESLGYTPLTADLGSVRVLGYRWMGEARPGRPLELHIAWQASGPQEPAPSFTGRLWGSEGTLLAQSDRWLGSDAAPGEVRFAALDLALPVDRCAGSAAPTLGVYTVSDGAFQDAGAMELPHLTPTCAFPTLPTGRVHLGVTPGGPWLRGVDYHVGEQTTAYLHWCGPGNALVVHTGEAHAGAAPALVHPLSAARCQTVRQPVAVGQRPEFTFTRLDGSAVQLWSAPLPMPVVGAVYAPFGGEMVLMGAERVERGGLPVLDLRWRPIRPLVEDYAVSVRFTERDGAARMHDIQPGLGALPTLKWVTRDGRWLDPHPLTPEAAPETHVTVTIYERFRITPLRGDAVVWP